MNDRVCGSVCRGVTAHHPKAARKLTDQETVDSREVAKTGVGGCALANDGGIDEGNTRTSVVTVVVQWRYWHIR
jgi:hypothetical protein